jgi:hypothetical protein
VPNIIGPDDRNHPLVMLEKSEAAHLPGCPGFPFATHADGLHFNRQRRLMWIPERAVAFDHVCVATFWGHISTGSGVH